MNTPQSRLLKPLLCVAAAASAFNLSARAGETFNSFMKICAMARNPSELVADGYEFGGSGGTGAAGLYQTLADHGVNYVRLPINVSPNDTYFDETHIEAQATYAKNAGLKVELDILYADNSFGGVPASWQSAWNSAVQYNQPYNGNPGYQIGSGTGHNAAGQSGSYDTSALEAQVYNYTYGLLTDFKGNSTPIDLVSVGNEIDNQSTNFIGIPRNNPLWAQLVWQGCHAVREWDKANTPPQPTGVSLHLIGVGQNGGGVWTECNNLVNAKSIYGIPTSISFDAFGFSFHAVGETLDQLNTAFWKENLGNFTCVDTGKPVWLFVQECEYAWTLTDETFNGQTWPITNHSSGAYSDSGTYACDPSGYHDYLMALMNTVAGNVGQRGVGACTWATDDITGLAGVNKGDYNWALWDSEPDGSGIGELITTNNGTTVMSAFNHTYTLNR